MTLDTSARETLRQRLLAQRLDGGDRGQIPAVPAGQAVGLTPSQAGIWFLSRMHPTSSEYSIFETLILDRAPSEADLVAAVGTLMERHDGLRLRIFEEEGEPWQEITEHGAPVIEWHDVSHLRPPQADGAAMELAVAASRRVFRLDHGPLWAVTAIRLPGGRALLVLVIHHLAADFWSWQIVLSELTALLAGEPLGPPPAVSFVDYAAWSQTAVAPAARRTDLAWWLNELDGELPVLQLPADRPSPVTSTRDGHSVPITFAPDVREAVDAISRQTGTSHFTVCLAAYFAFLQDLTSQSDLLVGTALAGRDHPSTYDVVGCFVRLVALRNRSGRQATGRELIDAVHRSVVAAQDHQAVSFDEIVAELRVPREFAIHPVVQTFFGMQEAETPSYPGARLGSSELTERNGTGRWELDLTLTETAAGTTGYVTGLADRFDPATLARFADMYLRRLEALVTQPDVPLRKHSIVAPQQRHSVVSGAWSHRPSSSFRSLTEPFEDQVRRRPGAVALLDETTPLTYQQLDAASNQVARFLRNRGAKPGAAVALLAERTIAAVVAVYGIVKSGGVYVPLDPEWPDVRIQFALEEVDPVVVLVDDRHGGRVPAGAREVIRLNEISAGSDSDRPLEVLPGSGGMSHLFYTSGSTGRAKGVLCSATAALADIFSMQARYPYSAADTTLLKTSFGFDTSLWELFWPLYFGARVVVCPTGHHGDPDRLAALIDEHRVTAVYLSPTMLRAVLDALPEGGGRWLHTVLSGGETVSPLLRDLFYSRLDAILVNGYGPTETGCAVDTVIPAHPEDPCVPLGRPHPDFRLYVLDDDLRLLPPGLPGEAYLASDGVNPGYFRRSALTAERFLPDPFGPPGSRMYRTGDVCRYRSDGVLEHLGRLDRQLKLRGLRVEPAEIEAVLCEHVAVAASAVLPVEVNGSTQLVAFVKPQPPHEPDLETIREHAAGLLPRYMVPASIQVVGHIPTTVNGKVDTAGLLAHWNGHVGRDQPAEQPATPVEAGLCNLFARLLGVESVSPTDNFFELGGHSLLIFRLIAACEEELSATPTVADVFDTPTARELGEALAGRAEATNEVAT